MDRFPETLHVVLVHPEIHWNTGNVGRTCLAAGARLHLVEPLGFSLAESEVRRAGLDYWPRVPLTVWRSWRSLEQQLEEVGNEPWMFSAEAERSYWEVDFPERPVLVFGSESSGLSEDIRCRYRDRLLAIPQQDPALRSLNLSTSAALAMYEVLRQRQP
jgi:tRNA (cytidine/uridine-2'-O-)-methyltransferase